MAERIYGTKTRKQSLVLPFSLESLLILKGTLTA